MVAFDIHEGELVPVEDKDMKNMLHISHLKVSFKGGLLPFFHLFLFCIFFIISVYNKRKVYKKRFSVINYSPS